MRTRPSGRSCCTGSAARARWSLRWRRWRSRPVEASGPDYLNAVACVRTRLSPEALLPQKPSLPELVSVGSAPKAE